MASEDLLGWCNRQFLCNRWTPFAGLMPTGHAEQKDGRLSHGGSQEGCNLKRKFGNRECLTQMNNTRFGCVISFVLSFFICFFSATQLGKFSKGLRTCRTVVLLYS